MTEKATVVYEDRYLRVVQRPDSQSREPYFDVETRSTDAMGGVRWLFVEAFVRRDNEAVGRDWMQQLLARILDREPSR